MFWTNLKRILKTGFVNFWRNGTVTLSAVLVMSITLLIISSVIFTGAILDSIMNGLKESVDVNITILPTVSVEETEILRDNLINLPEVESVELKTREEVLSDYKVRHENDQNVLAALNELEDNPFGAVINIQAVNPDNYESIYLYLSENYPIGRVNSIIDDVNFAQKKQAIDRLNNIINEVEKFGIVITIMFVALSLVITLNTIRLTMYISKDEIRVMNLVGAESGYITGPFIVMGAMYGVVSGLVVMILLYPITFWFGPMITEISMGLNLFSYYIANFGNMFFIIFSSGILIGSISSIIAINRYMKN